SSNGINHITYYSNLSEFLPKNLVLLSNGTGLDLILPSGCVCGVGPGIGPIVGPPPFGTWQT
ncbi:unnamed protein product, partial [Amoebophrya sp. A120]